jgi:hypothetical protein
MRSELHSALGSVLGFVVICAACGSSQNEATIPDKKPLGVMGTASANIIAAMDSSAVGLATSEASSSSAAPPLVGSASQARDPLAGMMETQCSPPRPKPLSESVDINRQVANEDIQRIMRAHFPQFRKCYAPQAHAESTVEGTVTVKFTIGRDGVVVSDVATGLGPVATCVAKAVCGLAFLQRDEPAHVVYPVGFGPSD